MSGSIPTALSAQFRRLRRQAQRRAVAVVFAVVLPPGLATTALAALSGGRVAALVAGVIVLALVTGISYRRARQYDAAWLVRRLDGAFPQFEDSSALAIVAQSTGTQLQTLQQSRMTGRIGQAFSAGLPDLREPYPRRSLLFAAMLASFIAAFALALPMLRVKEPIIVAAAPGSATPAAIKLAEARLIITAPAYTGLAVQTVSTPDAKAPIDSVVTWRLRFDREPQSAALLFHDGSRLDLQREGGLWQAGRTLVASALYRIELDGRPPSLGERAYRLDAIPDQPPEVTVRAPEKTLTLLDAQRKSWDFAFEARDDYGLGDAELTISLAQGSGEQIKVTEKKVTLDGSGDRRARRYRSALDLAALGFTRGDDLIVRLSVADNHAPQANVSESASFILRWPPERSTDSAGLTGAVQKALPAYFRSERQIIIDTEALIPQRGALPESKFSKQADELGIDQKVLRLRYGQFLGEGFESKAEHAQVSADEARQAAEGAARSGADNAPAVSLKDVPPEAEAPEVVRKGFGQEEDFLHEYGHAHDNGEAATLLDPETRRILKAALDEMWQAELNLRQARPEDALPFEYKALDYIKQVQQAERIYLARAGLDLPQVDAARRLSGERKNLSDRRTALPASPSDDSPVSGIVAALDRSGRIDVAALDTWLRAHPDATDDALGLLAAADRVQREPDCGICRGELKARLWPLLPTPPTALRTRRLPDAAGAAYLDALPASPRQ